MGQKFYLINSQEKPSEKFFQSQTHLTEDGYTVRFSLMEMKSFVKVLLFLPKQPLLNFYKPTLKRQFLFNC